MKKLFLSMAALALLFTACDNDSKSISQEQEIDMSDFYVYTDASETASKSVNSKNAVKSCQTMVVLNRQLNENPGLAKKMYDIEYQTRKFIAAKKGGNGNGNGGGGNGGGDNGGGDPVDDGLGTINIPVYVYVIYSNSNQNISDAQVNSQIAVLNNDFNDTNFSDVRSQFQSLGADIDITFNLQSANIQREFNSRSDWGLNDAVKTAYPPKPGFLTMWVANLPSGYLGYAQFPGGPASTDGVVMSPQYFGSADYDNNGSFYLDPQFNLGRTTTHEVGHWMNLRHIWGDGRCRQDDFVSDTPASDNPNYGCALSHVSCRSTDMVENYMDYSDDGCMGLFTEGQKARMRAVFADGAPRAGFRN